MKSLLNVFPKQDTWQQTAQKHLIYSRWIPVYPNQSLPGNDHTARNISRIFNLFPSDFSFIPKFYLLPHNYKDLKQHKKTHPNAWYIKTIAVKRKGFIFTDLNDLCKITMSEIVLQNYVTSPLLLNGFKFDFRIYVLVTSIEPLAIFEYRDGLATLKQILKFNSCSILSLIFWISFLYAPSQTF